MAFETSDALFGPVNSPIFEEREEESGEKVRGVSVDAIVPREANSIEVFGKCGCCTWTGRPPRSGKESRSRKNLMAKANNCPPCDGPIVYNIRRTFPGRVYVDEKDYFVSENMEEDVGVRRERLGRRPEIYQIL